MFHRYLILFVFGKWWEKALPTILTKNNGFIEIQENHIWMRIIIGIISCIFEFVLYLENDDKNMSVMWTKLWKNVDQPYNNDYSHENKR